jgi:hypothetical protein
MQAYNKMAYQAAKTWMDQRVSLQVFHPSSRPHAVAMENLLASGFQE